MSSLSPRPSSSHDHSWQDRARACSAGDGEEIVGVVRTLLAAALPRVRRPAVVVGPDVVAPAALRPHQPADRAGVLLAGLAALLGTQVGGVELYVVAAGILLLKAGVLPAVLRRAARRQRRSPGNTAAGQRACIAARGRALDLGRLWSQPTPGRARPDAGHAGGAGGHRHGPARVLHAGHASAGTVPGGRVPSPGQRDRRHGVPGHCRRTPDRGARGLHGPPVGGAGPAGAHRASARAFGDADIDELRGAEGPMSQAAEIGCSWTTPLAAPALACVAARLIREPNRAVGWATVAAAAAIVADGVAAAALTVGGERTGRRLGAAHRRTVCASC